MFTIKAFAESSGGTAGYNRAVARQYAQQYGVSIRQANSAIRNMAGNRYGTPFGGKGRRSTRSGALAAARRNAGRG